MNKLKFLTLTIIFVMAVVFVAPGLQTAEVAAQSTVGWGMTGSMITGRAWHTATLLPDGRVLVAGGYNNATIASAEVYDSTTGIWSETGSLNNVRNNHTATLLPDGHVLVAGGYNDYSEYLYSAEIYDPATGVWSMTSPMNYNRAGHTATLLPGGHVLVVGGSNENGAITSAEIFDPDTGVWSPTGSLNIARTAHTGTLLTDGRVLVAGGRNGYDYNLIWLASSELFDPATGVWSETGAMNQARDNHTATMLSDGRVLVAGGNFSYNFYLSSSEIFDPATGVWSPTGSINDPRHTHTATLLLDGQVLVAGGSNDRGELSSSELYVPDTGTWNRVTPLNIRRSNHHTATLLLDGRVLVAGGYYWNYGYLNQAEVYGQQPPPVNDNFADAIAITQMPYEVDYFNTGATTEDGEPGPSCGNGPIKTIWYSYTPTVKGILSGFPDAKNRSFLAIYTGTSFNDLVQLGSDCQDGASYIPVTPGVTYYFQVGSVFEWKSGIGTLHLNFAPAPPNDDFTNASIVGSVPFSTEINNFTASTEPGEPASSCSYSGTPYRTVWYAYQPPETGLLSGSTSAGLDGFIGIYSGNSLDSLSEITCTYTRNQFQINVTQGSTYYIQIGSLYEEYSGTVMLNLDFVPRPANDDFDNAKLISELSYSDGMDTSNATWASDDPTECHNNGSVWYSFTPQTNMMIEANTFGSNYDTTLAVYTGTRGALSLVPGCCNDDYNGLQSYVSFTAIAGNTYYFLVGRCCGTGGDGGGNLVFNAIGYPSPGNDNFADAMEVSSIPFSYAMDNRAATIEASEPNPGCYGGSPQRTIWYRYTPSANGSMTAEKDGFFYSFMAVYRGDSLDQLTLLRCAAYGYNRFTFYVEAGETYYMQFGGFVDWDYGNLTILLSVPPPPVADFWLSPSDPNRFDTVQFCDASNDPVGEGFNYFWWNFGDGSQLETTDGCVNHQFMTDGDYSVWHKAQTNDGRTGETTKVVSVRTHDVAITKFSVPQSASAGQTRPIVVGIRNSYYPENVTVELYKSTPYGYVWVGTLNGYVPVRPANRTTDFNFSYTFTKDDARLGKVTFKAVVTLNNYRDALPADNEAISMPVKLGR